MDKRSMVIQGEPARITCNGRRYFSKAHKEAVVAKCLAPGASLAAVALANGFNANLVRKWVRQHHAREASAKSSSKLLPVTIEAAPSQAPTERAIARLPRSAACGTLEIRIGTVELIVHGLVDAGQLSRVLQTLLRAR